MEWKIPGISIKWQHQSNIHIYMLFRNNLQNIHVKLAWHFRHFFTNCSLKSDTKFAFVKTTDQKEFCVLIKRCFGEGKHCSNKKLAQHYGNSLCQKEQVYPWFGKFKCRHTSSDTAAIETSTLETNTHTKNIPPYCFKWPQSEEMGDKGHH